MKCQIIKGFRDGVNLLYVPSEKFLYRFKANRNNGEKDWICYQTILAKSTKNKRARKADRRPCSARVRTFANEKKKCKKMNVSHSSHEHHIQIMGDMKKLNNIKEKCQILRKEFPEDASLISTRHIYTREIKKYV